jgi:hypothetical protein
MITEVHGLLQPPKCRIQVQKAAFRWLYPVALVLCRPSLACFIAHAGRQQASQIFQNQLDRGPLAHFPGARASASTRFS